MLILGDHNSRLIMPVEKLQACSHPMFGYVRWMLRQSNCISIIRKVLIEINDRGDKEFKMTMITNAMYLQEAVEPSREIIRRQGCEVSHT